MAEIRDFPVWKCLRCGGEYAGRVHERSEAAGSGPNGIEAGHVCDNCLGAILRGEPAFPEGRP
jgi:hypothetical protein